jgi:hypothetical protein
MKEMTANELCRLGYGVVFSNSNQIALPRIGESGISVEFMLTSLQTSVAMPSSVERIEAMLRRTSGSKLFGHDCEDGINDFV